MKKDLVSQFDWKAAKMNVSEARALGMKWGKTHGYLGMIGGWIYRINGSDKPVCQGWANLYLMHSRRIDQWIKEGEKYGE